MLKKPKPFGSGFAGWADACGPESFVTFPEGECYSNCRILFRGFISNRAELTTRFFRATEAKEGSDARLFAAAYLKWGEQLQIYVLGEFCAVVIDEKVCNLLLFTDALGLRPLFYTRANGKLVFASHLDNLLHIIGTPKLDDAYICEYLTSATHHGFRTIYEGVETLECGHTLAGRPMGKR